MDNNELRATAGVPPLVVQLVQFVGRLFYRDEFIIVLDRLAREYFIREDDLGTIFFALEERKTNQTELIPTASKRSRQIMVILDSLIEDKLVCYEDVNERNRSYRDARLDFENQMRDVVKAIEDDPDHTKKAKKKKKRKHEIDYEEEFNDDDEDDSEGDDDGHIDNDGNTGSSSSSKNPHDRRKNRSNAGTKRCYYINPRYFTDVVKYRLFLMRRHLENLQRVRGGSENVFRCSNKRCIYECTLLEAEARRQTVIAAKRSGNMYGVGMGNYAGPVVGGGGGGGANGKTNSAASNNPSLSKSTAKSTVQDSSEFDYVCPLCNSLLAVRAVENIAAAASNLLNKFNDILRQTRLNDIIKSLDTEPLGANRPSDNIRLGFITMHSDRALKVGEVNRLRTNDMAVNEIDMDMILYGVRSKPTANVGNNDGSGSSSSSSGTANGAAIRSGKAVSASSGSGRVFLTNQPQFEIVMDDGKPNSSSSSSSTSNAKTTGPEKKPSLPGIETVTENFLPEHLRTSVISGAKTTAFGFTRVEHKSTTVTTKGNHPDNASSVTGTTGTKGEMDSYVTSLLMQATNENGEPILGNHHTNTELQTLANVDPSLANIGSTMAHIFTEDLEGTIKDTMIDGNHGTETVPSMDEASIWAMLWNNLTENTNPNEEEENTNTTALVSNHSTNTDESTAAVTNIPVLITTTNTATVTGEEDKDKEGEEDEEDWGDDLI